MNTVALHWLASRCVDHKLSNHIFCHHYSLRTKLNTPQLTRSSLPLGAADDVGGGVQIKHNRKPFAWHRRRCRCRKVARTLRQAAAGTACCERVTDLYGRQATSSSVSQHVATAAAAAAPPRRCGACVHIAVVRFYNETTSPTAAAAAYAQHDDVSYVPNSLCTTTRK